MHFLSLRWGWSNFWGAFALPSTVSLSYCLYKSPSAWCHCKHLPAISHWIRSNSVSRYYHVPANFSRRGGDRLQPRGWLASPRIDFHLVSLAASPRILLLFICSLAHHSLFCCSWSFLSSIITFYFVALYIFFCPLSPILLLFFFSLVHHHLLFWCWLFVSIPWPTLSPITVFTWLCWRYIGLHFHS